MFHFCPLPRPKRPRLRARSSCCLPHRPVLLVFSSLLTLVALAALGLSVYALHVNAIIVSSVLTLVYALLLSGVARRRKDSLAEWMILALIKVLGLAAVAALWIYFMVMNLLIGRFPATEVAGVVGSLAVLGENSQ